jgi:DMSO/TMAO reductase YedYZ molybdopterin-dependent catalytic subunit
MSELSRRKWIGAGITAGGLAVAAKLADQYGLVPPDGKGVYGPGATLSYVAHRLITSGASAREFGREQISKTPYPNGKPPMDSLFKAEEAAGFSNWKVTVGGMVERPASYSLGDLKALALRSQITQLSCEEGWSYIAEWTGVPLGLLLEKAGVKSEAKFVVYSSPAIQRGRYDSIDLDEALHPQTLVTYAMNGKDLPVGHGGPVRMRVPRQIGYKSIKFLSTITVTDSLKGFGKGLGSSAADAGYQWYAGI